MSWTRNDIRTHNLAMSKKEALEIAREAKESLTNFNDVNDEVGYTLKSFELDGYDINIFVYIRKEKDADQKWYAVYAGAEYDGGDNIYADYDHSTNHLRLSELADSIYELANLDKNTEYLNSLRKMITKS